MPNIVFATNNVSHFPTLESSSDTAHFDASRVPYAFAFTKQETISGPVFKPVSGDTTWFHFRTYITYEQYTYGHDVPMIEAFDEDNNRLFYIVGANDTGQRVYISNGDQTINEFGELFLTPNKICSVDIKFTINGLILDLELYINGSLSSKVTMNSNPNAWGKPVRFSLGAAYALGFTDYQYYSEVLVADGDTRNARMNLLRPIAVGADNNWDGPVGALADDDTTTGMTTTVGGTRQTLELSEYTGATNISNIVCVTSTTRGINSPTGIRHFVRSAAVNYDHPVTHSVGFPIEYQVSDFNLNPATSLPWVASDLDLVEMGFMSVT